jgi:hypothetical protein
LKIQISNFKLQISNFKSLMGFDPQSFECMHDSVMLLEEKCDINKAGIKSNREQGSQQQRENNRANNNTSSGFWSQ